MLHRWLWWVACLALCACSSIEPRPALSTYSCMKAVRDQLPPAWLTALSDKRLHCMASARIARQCSVSEAYLAGAGKELTDLFDGGDAEWADWQADRAGIACGRKSGDDTALMGCCEQAGW